MNNESYILFVTIAVGVLSILMLIGHILTIVVAMRYAKYRSVIDSRLKDRPKNSVDFTSLDYGTRKILRGYIYPGVLRVVIGYAGVVAYITFLVLLYLELTWVGGAPSFSLNGTSLSLSQSVISNFGHTQYMLLAVIAIVLVVAELVLTRLPFKKPEGRLKDLAAAGITDEKAIKKLISHRVKLGFFVFSLIVHTLIILLAPSGIAVFIAILFAMRLLILGLLTHRLVRSREKHAAIP